MHIPLLPSQILFHFATFAFARLQNASNMTESRIVFRALCALLPTPQNTKLVKESLCVLESVISRSKEDTLEETTQSKDWEMCESEDRRHATTITGRSPFSAYFQQVMQEVKEQVAGDETWLVKEDNPYFCPGIITVLFDTYLAIFPLWSGLLLGDLSRHESHEQDLVTAKKQPKTRDTNCHIEKWFGIAKHSIMQKEKKVKPGTFIRKMHQSLQARYTENIIQHNLPQKLLLQPEPPVNLDQSQETWMKKKEERFPSTKSKFYSVPQKIPKDWVKKKWRPGKIKHSFQEDSFSCGVFVMLMAKQVVEEFPKIPDRINITPSKEMMCHYRKNLAKDILLASVSREEYCSVCGKLEKGQTEEQIIWIQCESCKRWFHVPCLNINVPPEEQAWTCDLCV
ncbi:uncharacterized protein [Sinocyclocheilus grahami]|uniref:uncharacterized protein n=1 Tax=Sinocyclocheilus grahami TaxID=75366 RepID=UPI0007ACF666|nr:PREDICTED: uncharacterized protein LOC107579134 [Sinocyclocheilus grahami]